MITSIFSLATGIPGQYALYAGNSSQLFNPPIQLSEQSIHFAWSPTQLQFAYFSGSNLIVSAVRGTTLPIQIGHQPGVLGTAWSGLPMAQALRLAVSAGPILIFIPCYFPMTRHCCKRLSRHLLMISILPGLMAIILPFMCAPVSMIQNWP